MKNRAARIIILILFIAVAGNAKSKNPTVFSGEKGKYNTGYKRYFVFDSSRKYQLLYDENGSRDSTIFARPMLINVWYPTKEKAFKKFEYANYINFLAPDTLWKIFLKNIHDYNYKTIRNNSFRDAPFQSDTVLGNSLFDSLLQLDCGVIENANYATGDFPLIIYQQSLGGSIEENAFLCQSLAAQGFIVINCAYQSNFSNKIYADWNLERAEKDVAYLLHFAEAKLPVQPGNYHLLGFSFGAQSNFNLLTKSYGFKSVVSFDSRLEYYFKTNPKGYKDLSENLLAQKEKINVSMLLFTNQYAAFVIIDSLYYSDRTYVMAKDFNHYDFTTQKQLSNWLFCKNNPDNKLGKQQKVYQEICDNTIRFFKTQSSNTKRSFRFKKSENFIVEKMPVGVHQPDLRLENIHTPARALLAIDLYGLKKIQSLFPNAEVQFDEDILNEFAYTEAAKASQALQEQYYFGLQNCFLHLPICLTVWAKFILWKTIFQVRSTAIKNHFP